MKKVLFFMGTILLCSVTSLKAQSVIFEETFEEDPPLFEVLPAGWSAIDRSGTGLIYKWMILDEPTNTDPRGFSGKVIYVPTDDVLSDELLISPVISIPAGNSYSLTFLISAITDTVKHYAVYVLPSAATFSGNEIPVLEEDLTNSTVAEIKYIDISNYGGQDVKIYFRQFNGPTAIGAILLDTVQIVQETLGVSEISLDPELNMYPNPVSDYIYIKSKSKITKAEIFDVTGRKLDAELSDNKINMQKFQQGTYLIKMTTGNKTYSRKVIKK